VTDETRPSERLERARILAASVVLFLLVVSVGVLLVESVLGVEPRLDLGVVVTLGGMELGLVGAGPVVRLVGLK